MTGQSVSPVELEYPVGSAGWLRAHAADADTTDDTQPEERAA
jgi:hypothetical protein